MIDQQQEKLINESAENIISQEIIKKAYTISQYNQQFDKTLLKLVIYYRFDFQTIALHLYYKFPQFEYKITSKSVAFRWYQLQYPLFQQNNQLLEKEIFISKNSLEGYQLQNKQKQFQINFNNESQNKKYQISHYQLALQMSKRLSEQQNQSFLFYKPKFINDTQYKLQVNYSSESIDQHNFLKSLKQVVNNQFQYEFGNFQGIAQIAGAIEVQQKELILKQIQLENQAYFDDDFQQYESD